MQRPLVSIIIPLYNAENYIRQTLHSALNQSYPITEIIIVDDESADSSAAIAKSFTDKKIRVIQQPNAGAAVARNTGLECAKGSYIQFLDADDLLHPKKIEKQVSSLENIRDKVAVGNYIEFFDFEDIDEKTVPINQKHFIYSSSSPKDFLINLWGGYGHANFIQTSAWLVPYQLIKQAGFWRPYRCPDDDGEFFTRVLLQSKGIVHVPEAINYYRRFKTEGNLSNQVSFHALKNTLLTIGLKEQYIRGRGGHKRLNHAMARQYLNFAVYNYLNQPRLSRIAHKKHKNYHIKTSIPKIGGKSIHFIAALLGWKIALCMKRKLQKLPFFKKKLITTDISDLTKPNYGYKK